MKMTLFPKAAWAIFVAVCFSVVTSIAAEQQSIRQDAGLLRSRSPVYDIADPEGAKKGSGSNYDSLTGWLKSSWPDIVDHFKNALKGTDNAAKEIEEQGKIGEAAKQGITRPKSPPVPSRPWKGVGNWLVTKADDWLVGLEEDLKTKGGKIGFVAEVADAVKKIDTTVTVTRKEGGEEGAIRFVQETGKFIGGNIAGGYIAGGTAKAVAVLIGTGTGAGCVTIFVALAAGWGVTVVVEKGVDWVFSWRPYWRYSDTAIVGKLDPDLIRWLSLRTKYEAIVSLSEEDPELTAVLPSSMLEGDAVKILNTARQNCISRAYELLEQLPSPYPTGGGATGETADLDELADRIPEDIKTSEELKELVGKLAEEAVRELDLGELTGENGVQAQIDAYITLAMPFIQHAFEKRITQCESEARDLCKATSGRGKLGLHVEPGGYITLDLTTAKSTTIVVFVDAPDTMDEYHMLRRILKRAHRNENSLKPMWIWTGPDGKERVSHDLKFSNARGYEKFELTSLGPKKIALQRIITTGIEGAQIVHSGEVTVDVQIASAPADISGVWTDGKTVVRELPLLDKIGGGGAIDLGPIGNALAGLKGKPMKTKFYVKPNVQKELFSSPADSTVSTGIFTTVIDPPPEIGKQNMCRMQYRYAPGKITVTVDSGVVSATMTGTFLYNSEKHCWMLNGNWKLFGQLSANDDKKELMALGTITGFGPRPVPDAKPVSPQNSKSTQPTKKSPKK